MPTQQSISLQAGRSVQRVMYNAPCPCPTVTDTKYTEKNLSRRAFVNLTLLNQEYLRSVLTRTNFTKSTFALFSFKDCSGESITFTQVSMSDGCLANCDFQHAVWIGSWFQHIRMTNMNLRNNLFSNSNLNFVVFNRSNMKRCVFDDADLRNSTFCHMDAEGQDRMSMKAAKLNSCTIMSSTLNHVICVNASMTQCKMIDSHFAFGNFENAMILDCALDRCDVRFGNFSQSNLSQCIFHDVNCDGADFSSARLDSISIDASTKLTNILCTNAVVTGNFWTGHAFEAATFENATLSNCSFDFSDMEQVNFLNATMEYVQFHDTILSNYDLNGNEELPEITNFSDTVLTHVSIQYANCGQVSFHMSAWTTCSMLRTSFLYGDFTETTILDSILDSCEFTHSNFTKATLTRCSVKNSSLNNTDFSEAHLDHIETDDRTNFDGCIFTGAELTGNEWTDVQLFEKSRFDTASLFKCKFDGSLMNDVNFRGADLVEVSFKGTILGQDADIHSDFTEATLDIIETDGKTSFDHCTFYKAKLVNFALDNVSMSHCDLNHAALEHVECINVIWTESTFHHASLFEVTFDSSSNLEGVSFIDTEMDEVKFNGTNLDTVVFDQSKLFNLSFQETSLIGTSFVGSSLSDVDFTDAVLSADSSEGQSEEATVATKFAEATLTRVTFQGGPDANLRFTIFSESTLSLCTFTGQDSYNKLDLSEANFDGTIVTDTTFDNCDLTDATFANSTLSRCHFVKCAMRHVDTDNVQLEYCTADIGTVLPPNWDRDSNGWIILQDPGPLPDEEEQNQIMTLGVFGDSFRVIQSVDEMNENGEYVVTWIDGSTEDATRIHKMSLVQPEEGYEIDDAVFVCIQYDDESGDNRYLHGKIQDTHVDGTYDIEYYTSEAVEYATADNTPDGADIFRNTLSTGK